MMKILKQFQFVAIITSCILIILYVYIIIYKIIYSVDVMILNNVHAAVAPWLESQVKGKRYLYNNIILL